MQPHHKAYRFGEVIDVKVSKKKLVQCEQKLVVPEFYMECEKSLKMFIPDMFDQ